MIKILFICHGNICRSPMAEFVMKKLAKDAGLEHEYIIESAATSTEEIWGGKGNPIYPPALRELKKHGIDGPEVKDKRARQVTKADYDYYDYLICADRNNIRNTMRITGEDRENKIHLLLDFAGREGQSIADPWYSGDFASTWDDVTQGCQALLEKLMEK